MAYYVNGHYFRQCDLNSQPCEDLTSAHETFAATGPSSKLSLLAFGKNWEDITSMDYSHPKRKLYTRGLPTTHGGQQIIGIVVPGLAKIRSNGPTTETSSSVKTVAVPINNTLAKYAEFTTDLLEYEFWTYESR